jgi:hypothetical protein
VRASTTTRQKLNQPEITVECDDAGFLSPSLQWLLRWIESETAKGRQYLPEQTVQIGWSILEIRQRADGTLGLFEPDFRTFPVQFVDSVSNTLLHMFLHKSVTESVGLERELAIPRLQDSAITCREFGSTDGFIMSRVASKGPHSGWFLGCDNASHDHARPETLRRVSLYEAAIRHEDRIIPFLGLPHDTFIGFGGQVPYLSRGETELEVRPGSYLYRKYVERTV